jgi:methyl-accepting chemotaxis protein
MAEITFASDDQRDGLEQINLAVTQMDQVTQENAAMVEEAAAAAASMQEQAARLSTLVGVFNLGQGTAASMPFRQPRPPRLAA